MTDFETDMNRAGDALLALAEGPGVQAADALAAAFGRAGSSIETTLGQAARSGELNFERMADSILRDLSRVTAEALTAMADLGGRDGQSVNLNMNFAPGTDERGALESQGAMSAVLARLVAGGGRYL